MLPLTNSCHFVSSSHHHLALQQRPATLLTPFFRDTETDRLPEEVIEAGVEAKTEDMEDQGREDPLGFLNEIDLQRKGKLKNPIDLHYWS